MHAKSNAPVLDEKGTSTILERPDSSPAELSAAASTVEASSYADADPQGRSGEFSRIEKGLAALTRLLSEHANAIVALWLCVVAASMVGFSRQKPLWADEVIFRWIATLPSVRDIWHALALGLNTDPPLDHLLTHGLTAIFGAGTLVVRLTSIGGICLMLLSLFVTLRKFVGPLYALLGLALPFCTILVDYGYEARPYALMYGCFGLDTRSHGGCFRLRVALLAHHRWCAPVLQRLFREAVADLRAQHAGKKPGPIRNSAFRVSGFRGYLRHPRRAFHS